jgi:hypothetical protein
MLTAITATHAILDSDERDIMVANSNFLEQTSKKENEKNWQTFGRVTSCLRTGDWGPQISIVVRSELIVVNIVTATFLSGAKLATLVSVLSGSGVA